MDQPKDDPNVGAASVSTTYSNPPPRQKRHSKSLGNKINGVKKPKLIARLLAEASHVHTYPKATKTAIEVVKLLRQQYQSSSNPSSSSSYENRTAAILRNFGSEFNHPSVLYADLPSLLRQLDLVKGTRAATEFHSAISQLLIHMTRCTGVRGALFEEYIDFLLNELNGDHALQSPPNYGIVVALNGILGGYINRSAHPNPSVVVKILESLIKVLGEINVEFLEHAISALKAIANQYPLLFEPKFEDFIEILMGWLVEPGLSIDLKSAMCDIMIAEWKYFLPHLGTWMELLEQCLQDYRTDAAYEYAAFSLCKCLLFATNVKLNPATYLSCKLDEPVHQLLETQFYHHSKSLTFPSRSFSESFHLLALQAFEDDVNNVSLVLCVSPVDSYPSLASYMDRPGSSLSWTTLFQPESRLMIHLRDSRRSASEVSAGFDKLRELTPKIMRNCPQAELMSLALEWKAFVASRIVSIPCHQLQSVLARDHESSSDINRAWQLIVSCHAGANIKSHQKSNQKLVIPAIRMYVALESLVISSGLAVMSFLFVVALQCSSEKREIFDILINYASLLSTSDSFSFDNQAIFAQLLIVEDVLKCFGMYSKAIKYLSLLIQTPNADSWVEDSAFMHILDLILGIRCNDQDMCGLCEMLQQVVTLCKTNAEIMKKVASWCINRFRLTSKSENSTLVSLVCSLNLLLVPDMFADSGASDQCYFENPHPLFTAYHARPFLIEIFAKDGVEMGEDGLSQVDFGMIFESLAGSFFTPTDDQGALLLPWRKHFLWCASQVSHYLIRSGFDTEFGGMSDFFSAVKGCLHKALSTIDNLCECSIWPLTDHFKFGVTRDHFTFEDGKAPVFSKLSMLIQFVDILEWAVNFHSGYDFLKSAHCKEVESFMQDLKPMLVRGALVCGQYELVLLHGIPLIKSYQTYEQSKSSNDPVLEQILVHVALAGFFLGKEDVVRGYRCQLDIMKPTLPYYHCLEIILNAMDHLLRHEFDDAYAVLINQPKSSDFQVSKLMSAVLMKLTLETVRRSPSMTVESHIMPYRDLIFTKDLNEGDILSPALFGIFDALSFMHADASPALLSDLVSAGIFSSTNRVYDALLIRNAESNILNWNAFSPQNFDGPLYSLGLLWKFGMPPVYAIASAKKMLHSSRVKPSDRGLLAFLMTILTSNEVAQNEDAVLKVTRLWFQAHLAYIDRSPSCYSHIFDLLFSVDGLNFIQAVDRLCSWTIELPWDPYDSDFRDYLMSNIPAFFSSSLKSSELPSSASCVIYITHMRSDPELKLKRADFLCYWANRGPNPTLSLVAISAYLEYLESADNDHNDNVVISMHQVLHLISQCSELKTLRIEPRSCWLLVLTAIFPLLNHPRIDIGQVILNLLSGLCSQFPRQMQLPIHVGYEAYSESRSEDEQLVRKYEHLSALVNDAIGNNTSESMGRFINELQRISSLWNEMWFFYLGTCLGRRRIALPDVGEFEELMSRTVLRHPETPHEELFCALYLAKIEGLLEELKGGQRPRLYVPRPLAESPADNAYDKSSPLWQAIASLFSEIKSGLESSHLLADISPFLAQVSIQDYISVPENLDPKKMAFIKSFIPHVQVFATKTRPKKIGIVLDDERVRHFLCKGHEDLRVDDKILLEFALCNKLLASKSVTESNKEPLLTFGITPLGHHLGLIEWVEDSSSMFSLYMKWKTGSFLSSRDTESKHNEEIHGGQLNMTTAYLEEKRRNATSAKQTTKSLSDKFIEAQSAAPKILVYSFIRGQCKSPANYLEALDVYAGSLAATSIMGFILGIGDRHLENILLSKDFRLLHIDFNVCFEKGLLLRVPETVPFRLTQNMSYPLLFEKGMFADMLARYWGTLKDNSALVLSSISAFMYEPLDEWFPNESQPASVGVGSVQRPRGPRSLSAFQVSMSTQVRLMKDSFCNLEKSVKVDSWFLVLVKKRYKEDCSKFAALLESYSIRVVQLARSKLLGCLQDLQLSNSLLNLLDSFDLIKSSPFPEFREFKDPSSFLSLWSDRKNVFIQWQKTAHCVIDQLFERQDLFYPAGAVNAMLRVRAKLNPAIDDAKAMAENLIQQANSTVLLSRMYEGWMSWI